MSRQLPRRPTPVADGVLVRWCQFRHRSLVVRPGVVRDERRVVAEATGAARLARQSPLTATLEHGLGAVLIHQRNRADVGDPAVILRPDLTQKLREILLVARVLARVAGGA